MADKIKERENQIKQVCIRISKELGFLESNIQKVNDPAIKKCLDSLSNNFLITLSVLENLNQNSLDMAYTLNYDFNKLLIDQTEDLKLQIRELKREINDLKKKVDRLGGE